MSITKLQADKICKDRARKAKIDCIYTVCEITGILTSVTIFFTYIL